MGKKKGTVFEGSLKLYLLGAVQNEALYQIRQSGRVVFEDIGAYINQLEDNTIEEDFTARREKLQAAIQQLPEKCRNVFMAIALKGMSYKEIATRLNVSVNTVKTHYARALKQLRDHRDSIVLFTLIKRKLNIK